MIPNTTSITSVFDCYVGDNIDELTVAYLRRTFKPRHGARVISKREQISVTNYDLDRLTIIVDDNRKIVGMGWA